MQNLQLLKDIRSTLAVSLAWTGCEEIRSRLNVAIVRGEDETDELGRVRQALADALSTYRTDNLTVLVTAERQEAWQAVLDETGNQCKKRNS